MNWFDAFALSGGSAARRATRNFTGSGVNEAVIENVARGSTAISDKMWRDGRRKDDETKGSLSCGAFSGIAQRNPASRVPAAVASVLPAFSSTVEHPLNRP
ncbi:hypothetical protein [Shinella zoogloeoides]|uniref:hypothetical protein n=1 Tax=Shinella zoogloeoides TaxID=352475 RepID=UPI0013C2C0D1|nr:hypothetical protein [Shinella zoogloeoides]